METVVNSRKRVLPPTIDAGGSSPVSISAEDDEDYMDSDSNADASSAQNGQNPLPNPVAAQPSNGEVDSTRGNDARDDQNPRKKKKTVRKTEQIG